VTGCLFDAYEATALEEAAFRALAVYGRPADRARMMREAMARDFSWERSVSAYIDVYRRVVARGPRA
jgi:starch synthase